MLIEAAEIKQCLAAKGIEEATNIINTVKSNPVLITEEGSLAKSIQDVGKIKQKPHWESLAFDPAHKNQISSKSIEEALAGITAEEKGFLPGPIRRDPTGAAEFIDARGIPWDVKTPVSIAPNGKNVFNVNQTFNSIKRELNLDENVILNMIRLNKDDALSLVTKLKTKLSAEEIKKIITVFKEDLF